MHSSDAESLSEMNFATSVKSVNSGLMRISRGVNRDSASITARESVSPFSAVSVVASSSPVEISAKQMPTLSP